MFFVTNCVFFCMMTSMDGLLLDKSPFNRNGFSSSVNGGYAKPPENFFNIYDRHFSVYPSNQHLIWNRGMHKPSGSRPPPPPICSSLPSYLSAPAAIFPPVPLLQPPLLPLPTCSSSKSAPFPSRGKKINDTIAESGTRRTVRVRDQRKKRRPMGGFKVDPHLFTSPIAVSIPQTNMEEEIVESVVSPPPSSLPLPSFALVRLRSAAGSGLSPTVAVGCERRGEDGEMRGGATDEIRRLLLI